MWQEQTWLLTRQAENKNNLHARYMHLGLCQDIEHPKSLLLFFQEVKVIERIKTFGKWERKRYPWRASWRDTRRVTKELLRFAQLACKEQGDFLYASDFFVKHSFLALALAFLR